MMNNRRISQLCHATTLCTRNYFVLYIERFLLSNFKSADFCFHCKFVRQVKWANVQMNQLEVIFLSGKLIFIWSSNQLILLIADIFVDLKGNFQKQMMQRLFPKKRLIIRENKTWYILHKVWRREILFYVYIGDVIYLL